MTPKTPPPDYAASFAPVMGGRLVMICHTEADARPWVRLLTAAGLTMTKLPPAGRYSFSLDDRPDLTAAAPDLPGRIEAIPARSDARLAAETAHRLQLRNHLERLTACLAEAADFATRTAPGGDHDAGLWYTAVTEARELLDQAPVKPDRS